MSKPKKLYPYNGKEYTIDEICKLAKISKPQFYKLLREDWTINQIVNDRNYYHGLSKTRLYKIHEDMIDRCYNLNNKSYKYYGGRGIVVCDAWRNDKRAFFNWALSHGYNDNLSIDRIDINKGYSPNNCRWVTIAEQQRNKRNNYVLCYKNEWLTVKQIALIEGIKWSSAYNKYVYREKHRLPRKQLHDKGED